MMNIVKIAMGLAAVGVLLAGCAITVNTSRGDGETATQSATPNISPTVQISLPEAK